MRYLLLLIVAVVFLTGVVWWALFIVNAIRGNLRKEPASRGNQRRR